MQHKTTFRAELCYQLPPPTAASISQPMSSFSAKASPPAYGTAGIPPVQDVGQLVNNALAFQDDLNTLKNMLSHLDFAEQLTTQAESCQTVNNLLILSLVSRD
jgi:hypothetical protein